MNFNRFLILVSISGYLLIYIKFYPPFYSFADERVYIIQAESLSKGILTVPEWTKGFSIHKGKIGILPKYPPFYSLLFLSLPLKINFYLIFFVSFLIHIISFLLFYKILKFCNINPAYSLFYIFHPSFVLYSRTIMPDLYVSFLFLLTLYFHLKKVSFSYISNFLLSLLKPSSFPYSFIFIYDSLRKRAIKNFLFYTFSTFFSVFFIFIYLYFLHGNPSPYLHFSLLFIFKNLNDYFLYLNLNYPFLLIFGLMGILKIKIFKNLISGFLPVLIFYLLYIFHDKIEGNLFISSIMGLRFLLPFVSFLIIGYSFLIQNILKKKSEKFFLIFILFLGLFLSFLLMERHNIYLRNLKETKDIIYKYTRENDILLTHFEISKLLLPLWGKRENMYFTDFKKFTFFENLKNIETLPDSLTLVYTLRSGGKNLSFIKNYADSLLKIFPDYRLIYNNDYLFIYRLYSGKNFLPIIQ